MTSPLSQSQLSIFLACQGLDGKSGNYQIPFLYRLPTEIDLKKICRALEAFVAAHPYILSRLGFRWDHTSSKYVDMIFDMLRTMRYFD